MIDTSDETLLINEKKIEQHLHEISRANLVVLIMIEYFSVFPLYAIMSEY